MSVPSSPPRPLSLPASSRRQAVVGAIVLGLLLIISSARAIARVYTDFLWFREDVGYTGIWRTMWGARLGLGVVFTLLFGVLVWVNLFISQRSQPFLAGIPTDQPGLARAADLVAQRQGLLRIVVSVVLALMGGPAMAGQWQDWLLFRNGSSVGVKDPQFGKDLSLYLFRLPFLSALVAWTFAAVFVTTAVTIGSYVLNGGIRLGGRAPRTTHAVRVHLSVLTAILALIKAVAYWLNRYELTLSQNGYVSGAGYTDVKARVPALGLLALISITVAVLLLINTRSGGWVLPGVAGVVWLVVSIVAGSIYPNILQALVKSNQLNRERTYIQRNIAATGVAMGLSSIKTTPLPIRVSDNSTEIPTVSGADKSTLQNLRIWEPTSDIALQAFVKLQQNIDIYGFRDVDIDRYTVNGKSVPVVVAVRELDESSRNISSWIQRRLVNTHGKGLVVASANTADRKGSPVFVSDGQVSAAGSSFVVKKPQVYFGEGTNGYVVVGTKTPEVDGKDATTTFDGDGGVGLSGPIRRLAFALRFADANMLISSQIQSKSRLLYVRNIRKRAEKLAPFFQYDNDPYPVLLGGRIVWVLDAYTTSTRYPYGQSANTVSLSSDSGLNRDFNYVRNPVKVVVDAYNGSMQFFSYEPSSTGAKGELQADPIVRAIGATYPSLLKSPKDLDRLYPGLRAHFRYPEDLFRVQSQMIGRYQVKNPELFFQGSARWDVSRAPDDKLDPKQKTSTSPADPAVAPDLNARKSSMRPYYLLGALPGSDKQEFYLQSNLVPYSGEDTQQNLRAIFVARSDPADYGRLELYTLPSSVAESGPRLVAEAMGSDRRISEKENLLGQGGSSIYYGSVQVLPIAQSLLYVRPLFVQAGSNYPIYTYMSVWFRGSIGFGATLGEALSQVGLSSGSGPVTATPGSGGGSTTGNTATPISAKDALADIDAALTAAQAALEAGDLAEYQAKVDLARTLATEAVAQGQITVPGTKPAGTKPAGTKPAGSAVSTTLKPLG